MQGVLLRHFITFTFRSRYPVTLLALSLVALLMFMTSFIYLYAWGRPIMIDRLVPLGTQIALLAISGINAIISMLILINIAINVELLMQPTFTIKDLQSTDASAIEQCAVLLVEGFKEHWPEAWHDMESALKEVRELLAERRFCRIAVDASGNVVGWIAGTPQYDGHVWELHPLVVKPAWQQQGIGRSLVQDFEAQVRQRRGLTITLGTDDVDNMTSLSGANLYEKTWDRIENIRNLKGHPFDFYQKLGYAITGVVPDANGLGKPDILMSKRVGRG